MVSGFGHVVQCIKTCKKGRLLLYIFNSVLGFCRSADLHVFLYNVVVLIMEGEHGAKLWIESVRHWIHVQVSVIND